MRTMAFLTIFPRPRSPPTTWTRHWRGNLPLIWTGCIFTAIKIATWMNGIPFREISVHGDLAPGYHYILYPRGAKGDGSIPKWPTILPWDNLSKSVLG